MFLTAWLGTALSLLDGSAKSKTTPVTGRNPVLLIHGIADNADCMTRMDIFLRARGWEVHRTNLTPNWGQARLETLAEAIRDYADTALAGRRFDLVGFSMGGLVCRYYVQRMGGLERIDRFVTISTPHHGTHAARLLDLEGYLAMRPASPFLTDLDRDADRLRTISFTSIYTPFDAIILPASSSVMPQARNVSVPVWHHAGMILNTRSLRAVAQALKS